MAGKKGEAQASHASRHFTLGLQQPRTTVRPIDWRLQTGPWQRSSGMSTDDFRSEARALLNRLLDEAATNEQRDMMLEIYSEEFAKLHREYAHTLLNDVINDVRTRLDARLSPDPIRQTLATVQTTVQDLWKNIWGP
jgi:hypothetical protein